MPAMDGGTSREPSFLVLLAQHAERTPEKIAVRVLADDGSERERWSYAQLAQAVARTAHALAARVPAGERVLLLLPTGLDYIASFLGCFGAGVCAVPAYPPESVAAHAQRVVAIAKAARPGLVLAEPKHAEATAQRMAAFGVRVPCLSLGALCESGALGDLQAMAALPHWPEAHELALLQYTSGSTAQPKGVMVTHANLVANQAAITHAFGIGLDDVIVSWLPLYHDMGLLGSLLQALYAGCELVLLSPGQFVRSPARWLAAISRYGGTVSGGPDFGYRMCIERVPDDALSGLDLRSWRLAFTGAEPIRPATLAAFAERFQAHGLRPEALYACYGLAEATLLVTGAARDRAPLTRAFEARALERGELVLAGPDATAVTLVGCGNPMPGHSVRIAAASGEALPEGRVGEVWFAGASVTAGYFEAPRESAETFVERDGVRYLRTGDLGAVLQGELFITGREKDLIIVRGRNLYPQDIEQSVEAAVEMLQKGRVAAFAEQIDGEECVVVAVEVSRAVQKLLREDALVQAIIEAVAESHLESPRRVLLLKPGALPKTTSGKLQRRAARAAFRDGTLGVVARFERGVKQGESAVASPVSLSPLEQQLCVIWSELLGIDVQQPDAHFFGLGGNSVLAAQLLVHIAQDLQVDLSLAAVFKAPKVSELATLIEQARATRRVEAQPAAAVALDQPFPLSPAQRSLWLAMALDTQPAAFHVAVAIELRGQLQMQALETSLSRLMTRHAALRTTFDETQAEPRQRVHAGLPVPRVLHTDLTRAVNALGRTDSVRGFVECQVERAFDLAHGPLWSCSLAELDADSSVLVLTAHHLVLDGTSLRVLLTELVSFYRQATGALEPQLPAAVSAHELTCVDDPATLERELREALALLEGTPEHAPLPLDRARPAAPSRRAEREVLPLPEALLRALRVQARAHGVPLSVVLLSGLAALLGRYTGARGVRVGLPLSNRHGAQAARAVGLCVRTALLSLPVEPQAPLQALLPLVAARLQSVVAQPGLQLESLVRVLPKDRGGPRAAPFDVVFNYQWGLAEGLSQLPGVELLALDTFTGFTQFDLTLDVQEQTDGRVTCSFEYASDLFERATVQGMVAAYARMLELSAHAPSTRVGAVEMLSAREREQLAAAHAFAPNDALPFVPEQLAQVAARYPERVALCAGGERISYGALELRALALASRLVALGVGPEQCVGIHLARGVDAFAVMIGVWKAGAAFAPLDPSYPRARLQHMLSAAEIQLVISDDPAALELGAQQVLRVGDLQPAAAALPERVRQPRSLAYVIFTSGSTGLPKPVAVEHDALRMHCDAMAQLYEFGPEVCALHAASLSFDAAIEQWLLPALAGGRIVLRPDGAWGAHEVLGCVQLERVTHLYPPTPLLGVLAHEVLRTGAATSVQSCTVGGEAVSRETVALLERAFPGLALYNGYGPTETVVTPLLWKRDASLQAGYAPIGRAVGERRSYVLSDALELVPRGVEGELFVAGSGSARGYLGRPRETAERFLPDPFGSGGRVYRTGDLVRMTADATVHYLGRRDGQIKLRGHRIELGEVESALLDQPGVREAAALLRRGSGSSAQLCAYVAGDAGLVAAQLKAALSARLPSYMLPTHLVVVPALPRTPNGKLDAERLPQVQTDAHTGAAAEGPEEQLLAALFGELLGADEVGRDADFFALGGDSILALQLSSRARERGYALSPRQVLEHPSVRALAAVITPLSAAACDDASDWQAEVPLLPIARELFRLELPERQHYNHSLLLHAREALDTELLGAALEQVAQHHPAFRLRFDVGETGPRMWLAERAACPLELADAAGPNQLRSACERVQRGLHLTRGPLVRALLVRLPNRQERLLLCAHHLVMDGVSFRILLEDLGVAYAALRAGYTAQLPAASCSYATFSRALTRYAQSAEIDASRSYWQKALREPAGLWPTRSRANVGEAGRAVTRLDRGSTELLLSRAPAAYGTRGAELMLAALSKVLCSALGADAVRVELEGHGRELPCAGPDATRCIGWFTSTYPLVLHAGSASERIMQTKEALRSAQPHALAYGVLREWLSELADAPRPGLTFNYLGQLDGSQERSGFRLADEDRGPDQAESSPLRAGLNLDGSVHAGELSFVWTYDPHTYTAERVQALADDYAEALRELIAHCGDGARRALTPSDVPLAGLTQVELAALPFAVQQIEDVFALTPMQQGLLAHALSSAVADPYLVRRGFRLTGELNVAVLERALAHVVQTHAVLRSSYVWDGLSHPVQVVLRASSQELQVHTTDARGDLSAQAALRARPVDAAGFQLGRAGAGVFELVRVAEAEHWLFWTHHHIALDGWSMSSILLQLFTAYAQLAGGAQLRAEAAAPERSWRARQLQAAADEVALAPLLAGATPTALPSFGNVLPAAAAELPCGERELVIAGESLERLKRGAAQAGVTLSTLLQGAYALLLAQHAGVDDVILGVTLSGRTQLGERALGAAGLFINTLPLRVQLTAGENVVAYLRRVQQQSLCLQEHEHASLAALARGCEGAQGAPLFETALVFENYPIDRALREGAGQLGVSLLQHEHAAGEVRYTRGRNHFPLSVVAQLDERLSLVLSYQRARFADQDVACLAEQLSSLLSGLASSLEQQVTEVVAQPSVPALRAPAAVWNTEGVSVLDAFASALARAPEHPAVQDAQGSWSYRSLAARALGVSDALRGLLRGPEPRVAVVLPRSRELCAAMLGVLHAGAVYVPCEPDTPPARLRALLDAVSCQCVIATGDAGHLRALEQLGRPVLDLGRVPASVASFDAPRLLPLQAAYTIFTSGSTGEPKGVVVSHAALEHYVHGMLARLELSDAPSMALVSTTAADLGHTVLFGALCSGRTLHVLGHDVVTDTQAFADAMSERQVGVLKIVPSHLRALLDCAQPARVLPTHALILGGEATDAALLAAVRAARPGLRIVNHYGPTETTVGVLTHEAAGTSSTALPIGSPLPGVYVRVLDAQLRPVPLGAAGELYVGGPSLARGYHGRSAATAERFLPDPYVRGARLYRTGDRVRVVDEQLIFLARKDDQVKLRGYRVEPGEVASVLREIPGVRDAAVVVQRGEGSAQLRLVGFYACARGQELSATDLTQRLAERLPAYMLPELVELQELPRTANGKLDKQRLPVAATQPAASDAPEGPIEQKLAAILQDVLGLKAVSRSASFAAMGGDSILSLRVIARARKAGLALTPKLLVQSPSLRQLAEELAILSGAGSQPPAEPISGVVTRGELLSYEQERLWLLWKLDPNSSAYTVATALRLSGKLDLAALSQAFADVVARHEALRTAFLERDGQPFAFVQPAAAAASEPHWITDTTMPLSAATEALHRWASQPFDLGAGTPLRWGLVRVAADEHVLGIAVHHIVADGWSMNLLMSDFAAAYAARSGAAALTSRPACPARANPQRYAQYAAWQREQLAGPVRQTCLDYWRQQLGSEHAPIQLSFDRPRSPNPTRRAGIAQLSLDARVVERLRALARRENTTLFSVLLTAFQVLLARDSGERDVRVGVSMAQRPTVESEGIVGFFVQTLVHRTRLDAGVSFQQLLAQVSSTLLDAQAHAELPFSQLVAALAPERSTAHDPLVQVLFNHQKRATLSLLSLPELRVERLELPVQGAQFELALHTEEDERGELSGHFAYATDLFEAETAARLARRLEQLLVQFAAAPELRVDDADVLSVEDRVLTSRVNATARSFAKRPLVPCLIGEQLRALGARPALSFGDEVLSGLELDARANALAHHLRAQGVGPDSRVGVCLPRSSELLVSVLAVLKAGAAYVALEPELPDARLSRMLELSGAQWLITRSAERARFAPWQAATGGALDLLDQLLLSPSAAAPELALHGENLAYVIFTSGSTGQPKGVASRHAGLLNRLQWMQAEYALSGTDVVLQKTPFGFDVSVWELLWAFLYGAQLVVAEPEAHRDPAALAELITRHGVTTVHFVPSMLAAFLEHPAASSCTSLKRVICSGEALSPALRDALYQRLPHVQLHNLYGPTEASIDVTYWHCRAGEPTVPIGRPIANTGVLVLDAQLAQVPTGVVGELYLTGVGLARGYLRAGGLTAERFLPHPSEPGARMYRTGDRVRMRSDGALSYLGRTDAQVKLRGVRIELGEVEAALASCAGVQRAAAVLHAGTSLVGYVVGADLDPVQLQAELRSKLPPAFVPSHILVLLALPLTASGKLDRKALPAPAQLRAQYLAPEPGLQAQLARLWAELLRVERVGQRDDFFELGGHSLLGARLLARVESELGVRVPLKQLFAATRLCDFAALVEQSRAQSAGAVQLMQSFLDELEAE